MENVDPANIPLPDDGFIPPRDIKLPPFWQSRPAAWFVIVESRFRLRNIVDETAKFDHVLSALPEDMVGQILDLVEAAPAATPYTFLRARLLETHSLSDYKKWDMLQKTKQMGGRKPSKLLADMMEFCPAGLEQSLPFHYLFTQRLPQALRAQLEPGDPRALAARADKLWAVHAPTASAVAAVSSSEAAEAGGGACAAIRGGGKGYRGRGGQQRGRVGAKNTTAPAASSAAPAATTAAPKDPTPSALARFASDLCFFHWNFADRATKCSPPLQLGKLTSKGRLNAVAPGPLVHIEDQLSKRRFLVDTGASFSIYPFSSKLHQWGLLSSVLRANSFLAGGRGPFLYNSTIRNLHGPFS
jgi:hypothetical protein